MNNFVARAEGISWFSPRRKSSEPRSKPRGKKTKGDEKERERKDTRKGGEKKDGPVKKLIGARPDNE